MNWNLLNRYQKDSLKPVHWLTIAKLDKDNIYWASELTIPIIDTQKDWLNHWVRRFALHVPTQNHFLKPWIWKFAIYFPKRKTDEYEDLLHRFLNEFPKSVNWNVFYAGSKENSPKEVNLGVWYRFPKQFPKTTEFGFSPHTASSLAMVHFKTNHYVTRLYKYTDQLNVFAVFTGRGIFMCIEGISFPL